MGSAKTEKVDFSRIADEYEECAAAQKSAAEILLKLLKIGGKEDVLDLGCGTGHLTRKNQRTDGW